MRIAVPLEQCWHDVPGGTARTAIDLTTALAAMDGVEVVGVAARHADAPDPVWRPTVPVRHSRLPRPLLYEAWHGLRRPRVEAIGGPADLCHAVGGAVPGTDLPLVVTVHDLAFLHFPELFTRQGNRFFRRALHLIRRRADQVQVPSQATFDDCVAAGIGADRLRLVPWGCSVGQVTDQDIAAVRRRFDLPERWVVCVGTLEPRKNIPGLVRAWADLDRDDTTLVLVGPTGWGQSVNGSRLPENVSMTGFVEDHERDALYAGALASCYPSIFEGFGLPVLESMALGCPVVTASGTATEELVAGGAGVAVDPRSPEALAEALGSLLDDPARREDLARRAKRRASRYTWEQAAAAAVAGYQEVLT